MYKYKESFPVLEEITKQVLDEFPQFTELAIRRVIDTQFKFLHTVMVDGDTEDITDFKSIRLHLIGTFVPNATKLEINRYSKKMRIAFKEAVIKYHYENI